MIYNMQNRSVHAVATIIVFNWVPDNGLPDSGPQQSLKDCNVYQLVNINQLDLKAIRSWYRILVANILFAHFPASSQYKIFSISLSFLCINSCFLILKFFASFICLLLLATHSSLYFFNSIIFFLRMAFSLWAAVPRLSWRKVFFQESLFLLVFPFNRSAYISF